MAKPKFWERLIRRSYKDKEDAYAYNKEELKQEEEEEEEKNCDQNWREKQEKKKSCSQNFPEYSKEKDQHERPDIWEEELNKR